MVSASYKKPDDSQRILVVSCYRWEWQQILTLEGAMELRGLGFEVDYLEISRFESDSIKGSIKNFVKKNESLTARLRLLKSNGVKIHHPRIGILLAKIKVKMGLITPSETFRLSKLRWQVIYPGLVDITNDVNVNHKNHQKLIRRTLLKDLYYRQLLERCNLESDKYDSILIVNGRYPLNRAAAFYFGESNLKVNFIEFGSDRQKFQIYNQSPHSITNRQELFREFTQSLVTSLETIESVGSEFFKSRREFDKQANISWTRKMNPEKIPELDVGKRVCTFFPTSEKEFAGVSDTPPRGHFKNQHEALNTLIQLLGENWEIYIRRHPKATDSGSDPEATRWDEYRGYPNVKLIDPDSIIDSYALGMRSDLVAHYSSFIGPEMIFAGHKHVITLGPTQWESLDPQRHLHSAKDISNFLETKPGVQPNPDIRLFGFYMATFGKDFKLYGWDSLKGKWFLRQ